MRDRYRETKRHRQRQRVENGGEEEVVEKEGREERARVEKQMDRTDRVRDAQ
jgi:hypothetical protein